MNKKYWVYTLKSMGSKRIYVGMSNNVERRLIEHNNGYVRSTKVFRPWKVLYCKFVGNRGIARIEEKKLKSGYGREFLRELV